MQFTTRQLLIATILIAAHLAVQTSSIASRSAEHELLIPLTIAVLTAASCGWAKLPPSVSGLCAAAVALFSCVSLSAEVLLGFRPSGFLRAFPINPFAITIVIATGYATGVAVAFSASWTRRLVLTNRSPQ